MRRLAVHTWHAAVDPSFQMHIQYMKLPTTDLAQRRSFSCSLAVWTGIVAVGAVDA